MNEKNYTERKWRINTASTGPLELRVVAYVVTPEGETPTYIDSPFDALDGKIIEVGGETVKVAECTHNLVSLVWRDQTYIVEVNATITTDAVNREGDSVRMEFDYHHDTIYDRAVSGINEVYEIHKESTSSFISETVKQEEDVLATLGHLIAVEGLVEFRLYRALLDSCNNWSTLVIARISEFKRAFAIAVDEDDFEYDFAWDTLELAAQNNNPQYFMDDMDKYYDFLATATENGNDVALDIMNTIWEPENIIEED